MNAFFVRNFILTIGVTLVGLSTLAGQWSEYNHIDPNHIVPTQALEQAVNYYDQIKNQISNPRYLTVIDYTQHSSRHRFYLIDMVSGAVEALKVAHGSGSDKNNDGWAERFSNTPNSRATSLGFFLTGVTYNGKNGNSLILDGLSPSNSNAKSRSIVIHGASYVNSQRGAVGRSWGCPALDLKVSNRIINQIKKGSLIYAWGGQKIKQPYQMLD